MSQHAVGPAVPVFGGRRTFHECSRVCRLVESADLKLGSLVASLFDYLQRAAAVSLAWRGVSQALRVRQNVASHSLFVRRLWPLVKVGLAPYGVPVTADTAVGLALAVACVAPTWAVFIVGAGATALLLKDRSKQLDDNRRLWALPGLGTTMAVFAVFLFLVGATVSSVDPARSVYNMVIWCFYLLFFFMAADGARHGRVDNIIWPFLSGATLAGAVGIYQRVTGWRPPKSWLDKAFEDQLVRVVGTFSNPTFFAEMLGLALPLTIALLLRNKDWRDRLVLAVYAGVQSAALVLTLSRGAWLGFIVSFCVLAVLYERKFLFLGLAFGVVVFALAPDILLKRLISSFSLADSSNSYRLFIWRGSIAMLKDYLLRGVGLGAESFSTVYPEYMIIQTPAPHAHSTYLEMLIETGLFGFLSMAWLFTAWAKGTLKAVFQRYQTGRERWIKTGILAGVIAAVSGHMLQGVIEHTWYSPRVTIVFWTLMGIGAGMASGQRYVEVKES